MGSQNHPKLEGLADPRSVTEELKDFNIPARSQHGMKKRTISLCNRSYLQSTSSAVSEGHYSLDSLVQNSLQMLAHSQNNQELN